jgi:hypothetical protein
MEQVAAGDRFPEDALHEEPLREQLRSGRAGLVELFGGEIGTERPTHVMRRPPVFDRATRIGAAEHILRPNRQQHRATFPLRSGRIARWRGDQNESSLPVEQLSSATPF